MEESTTPVEQRFDECPPGYKKCGNGCIPEGSNCPDGAGAQIGTAAAVGAVGGAGAAYAAPKVANRIKRYRKLKQIQAQRQNRQSLPANSAPPTPPKQPNPPQVASAAPSPAAPRRRSTIGGLRTRVRQFRRQVGRKYRSARQSVGGFVNRQRQRFSRKPQAPAAPRPALPAAGGTSGRPAPAPKAPRQPRRNGPTNPRSSKPLVTAAPAPKRQLPALPAAGGTSGKPIQSRRAVAIERNNNRRTTLSNKVGAQTSQINAGRQQRGLAALPAAGRTSATRNTLGGRLRSAGQTVRSATFGPAQQLRNRVGALRQNLGSGLRQTGRNLKAGGIRTTRSLSRSPLGQSTTRRVNNIRQIPRMAQVDLRAARMGANRAMRPAVSNVRSTLGNAQRGLAARGRLARMQVGSARRSLGAGIQSARVGRRRTMQNVMRALGGATHR